MRPTLASRMPKSRGSPARPHTRTSPLGLTPTQSVKVPPRSIAICQPPAIAQRRITSRISTMASATARNTMSPTSAFSP